MITVTSEKFIFIGTFIILIRLIVIWELDGKTPHSASKIKYCDDISNQVRSKVKDICMLLKKLVCC